MANSSQLGAKGMEAVGAIANRAIDESSHRVTLPAPRVANPVPPPCWECGGTGKCRCYACHDLNSGNCLICNPSKKIVAWRALPSYRHRIGPTPPPGDGAHTPIMRYLTYLPEAK